MQEGIKEFTRKKNFFLSTELDDKIGLFIKETGLNYSQLLRDLLAEWVGKREKEKIDNEIMEACKFYKDIDKKIAEEWRSVESEV